MDDEGRKTLVIVAGTILIFTVLVIGGILLAFKMEMDYWTKVCGPNGYHQVQDKRSWDAVDICLPRP